MKESEELKQSMIRDALLKSGFKEDQTVFLLALESGIVRIRDRLDKINDRLDKLDGILTLKADVSDLIARVENLEGSLNV
jgi:hypothetical protein